jgi:hypothetical protein
MVKYRSRNLTYGYRAALKNFVSDPKVELNPYV